MLINVDAASPIENREKSLNISVGDTVERLLLVLK
jgi:hypothetical protein